MNLLKAICCQNVTFLRSKLLCLVLLALISSMFCFHRYWLQPKREAIRSQRIELLTANEKASANFSKDSIINILTAFTKVNNEDLWIDSINIEQKNVLLSIKGFSAQAVSEYIYEIEKVSGLKIESVVMKNHEYKLPKTQEESQEEPLPLAVKVYLERGGKLAKDGNTNTTETKFFYDYEATIKLSGSDR